MKVALVHDWLLAYRGGEKCLRAFLDIYPNADIVTLLHVPGASDPAIDANVRQTSYFQKLPGVRRYYRALLPLFPHAARSLKLEQYDLVISLSHAAAKNVRTRSDAVHICYCFTPMRYIWDQRQHYFGRATSFLWPLLAALRRWDVAGSENVDHFVSISQFVRARIRCYYGRDARVIYPPVDTSWIREAGPTIEEQGVAFLYAGALVPYKKPKLIVEVFNELGLPLWIAGAGPEEAALRRLAKNNISFLGRVSDAELAGLYRRCRALIFPGVEDFGMMPVECLAAGRPVIARCHGGLAETVNGLKYWRSDSLAASQASGVFLRRKPENERVELARVLGLFLRHEHEFKSDVCQTQAQHFGPDRFYSSWTAFARELGLPVPEFGGALIANA